MKIAPAYSNSVVHVNDASRAVNVVASLIDPKQVLRYSEQVKAEQQKLRDLHAAKQDKPLVSYADAVANGSGIAWKAEDVSIPPALGRRVLEDIDIAEVAKYIDWTFFFSTWDLKGRFPKILEDEKVGEAARDLFEHGKAMLQKLVDEKLLKLRAVYGFWPAAGDRDDIIVYEDESRRKEIARFPMLRQQHVAQPGKPNRCLADFVAPKDSGLGDYIGAFAASAGFGADELAARYEDAGDDYNSIMVKALADRLAEACAEWLHERARKEWGYAADERLSNDELIAEKYRGIRPAFGYPACPDHTPKRTLFALLQAPEIGIELTESCAMQPGASVSGLYFGHPEARYFSVGRLGEDQVKDYAARAAMSLAEAEKWLAPNLGYSR